MFLLTVNLINLLCNLDGSAGMGHPKIIYRGEIISVCVVLLVWVVISYTGVKLSALQMKGGEFGWYCSGFFFF